MKYKVGDKVRVKSLDWYNSNKDILGCVDVSKNFTEEMSEFCGKIAEIKVVETDYYKVDIDKFEFHWSDEMFENKKNMEKSDLKPGMVVKLRDDDKFILTLDGKGNLFGFNNYQSLSLDSHKEDLTLPSDKGLSIDKVYIPFKATSLSCMLNTANTLDLIWERPKTVELSMQEIADKFGISVEQLKIKK